MIKCHRNNITVFTICKVFLKNIKKGDYAMYELSTTTEKKPFIYFDDNTTANNADNINSAIALESESLPTTTNNDIFIEQNDWDNSINPQPFVTFNESKVTPIPFVEFLEDCFNTLAKSNETISTALDNVVAPSTLPAVAESCILSPEAHFTVINGCTYINNRPFINGTIEVTAEVMIIDDTTTKSPIKYSIVLTSAASGDKYISDIACDDILNPTWVKVISHSKVILMAGAHNKDLFELYINYLINRDTVPKIYKFTKNGWHRLPNHQYVYAAGSELIGNCPDIYRADTKFQFEIIPNFKYEDVLGMLNITPNSPIAPFLFLYTHLACLESFFIAAGHDLCFAAMLVAPSNSKKTSMATAMCQFFNRSERLMANLTFTSTINKIGLELQTFRDAIVIVDDFIAGSSSQEQTSNIEKLNSIMRAYGDRIPKKRMYSYTDDGSSYDSVSGLCLITGEYVTGMYSSMLRTIILEMQHDDVHGRTLGFYQKNPLILSTYLRNFIKYLADNSSQIIDFISAQVYELREQFTGKFKEPRHVEYNAQLTVAIEIVTSFLRTVLPPNVVNTTFCTLTSSIEQILYRNANSAKLHDPAFLAMLAFIYNKNSGLISGIPLKAASVEAYADFYYDDDFYYILPENLERLLNNYKEAQEINSSECSSKKLYSLLENSGFIKTVEEGTVKTKRHSMRLPHNRINNYRYMYIHRNIVDSLEVNAYAR